jgi:hypothetical protein
MDEQDTQDFGSRSELFLRSVFELFVAGCTLSFCPSFSGRWLLGLARVHWQPVPSVPKFLVRATYVESTHWSLTAGS